MLDLKKPSSTLRFASPVKLVDLALKIALLVTIICVFVPLSPGMPGPGLDQSWVFAMNQAVAQELSFGKDTIFTFGPYSSVYTKQFHPSTDPMMIGGSAYLALSYWATIVPLMKGVKWRWTLAIGLALLVCGFYIRDALYFSCLLVIALASFKIPFSPDINLSAKKYSPLVVALLFAPAGLLPLIKGSMLILCGAIVALCSIFFLIRQRKDLAIICLASPVASLVLFWVASGQSLASLPVYFIAIIPIVSSYTEAMAVNGDIVEIVLYLITSVILIASICFQKSIVLHSKIFLICTFFFFLFLSFKAGFVRHDGHALIPGASILIAALLLPFVLETKLQPSLVLFSLISWSYIDMNHVKTSTAQFYDRLGSVYLSAWSGLWHRSRDTSWPQTDYNTAVLKLKDQAHFPILDGTTDIYSYNQSYVIASGNMWSPRPVFQSYSAYAPILAEKNRNHLSGEHAPDNVIFRVESIDNRIPSMDDGMSWPVLLSKFRPTNLENEFLFLRKATDTSDLAAPLQLTSERHLLGEVVNVPENGHPIFAEIDIKPTIWGRLANILFKTSQLRATFELKNGTRRQYRIVSGMAKSGFVISPMVENTVEFGLLYAKNVYLDGKIVKSFSISSEGGKSSLWNDDYSVTFKNVGTIPQIDNLDIYNLDHVAKELSGYQAAIAEKCDGSIDTPISEWQSAGLLSINGWVASSVDNSILPEAVYVVLISDLGNKFYIKTRKTSRLDVGAHFKKPELNESGFRVVADISTLRGKYILGLAIVQSDGLKFCPQFRIPITIDN